MQETNEQQDDGQGYPCEWNYTDTYMCEHNPDNTCDVCEQASKYMVQVLITSDRDAPNHIGAPGGSSWEVPPESEQGAYALEFYHADDDVPALLRGEGFNPTECA